MTLLRIIVCLSPKARTMYSSETSVDFRRKTRLYIPERTLNNEKAKQNQQKKRRVYLRPWTERKRQVCPTRVKYWYIVLISDDRMVGESSLINRLYQHPFTSFVTVQFLQWPALNKKIKKIFMLLILFCRTNRHLLISSEK